jgi:uncharacterized protein YgiM (DUF1202 family)
MNATRRILTLATAVLFITLACMTTASPEEAGTAAPTAPLPEAPTAQEENPAGEVFQIPAEWAEPQGLNLCAIVTADEALHLRSEPSEHAQVLEWLLTGEQVRVINVTGEWWKVQTLAGLEGWARAKYLQEEECR